MQAVILAAGFGSRLKALTGGKSKALVEIGGRPLIHHQLEALADHGVGPVMVVIGHEADEVQKMIGDRAEVTLNDRFAETNSLYSLWLTREWVKGPFVLLNCDLLFDPEILARVLEDPGNVIAFDSTSSRGREQTKVAVKQRRVVDIGKDLPAVSARGESLGMLKFEADGSAAMMKTADALVRDGHENAWVIEATRSVCSQVNVYGVNVAGFPWAEIDFPYDLDVARREVWPAIWKGRWRTQVYWRRTRWLAAGVVAIALAVGGWAAKTTVGADRIEWETVQLAGVEGVRVETGGKSQRWWALSSGSSVTATVSGGNAMVELRLVVPAGAPDTLRYVVGLTVDGQPLDWRALTAVPDSTSTAPGLRLADRDRIAITLAPGDHQVGVTLVAGHSNQVLVRVRQPEDHDEPDAPADRAGD